MTDDTASTDAPFVHDPATIPGRLAALYGHPGPFVSVYLPVDGDHADPDAEVRRRWAGHHAALAADGIGATVIDALDARVRAPLPEDVAAVGLLAAADGAVLAEFGLEPPLGDVVMVDSLPYVAPLLEWHQRSIPHLIVILDDDGADAAGFVPDGSDFVRSIDAHVVMVVGNRADAAWIVDSLVQQIPPTCRLVTEPSESSVDELADAAVRHVDDTTARRTVGLLRELKFLAEFDGAHEGVAATLTSIADGSADVVVVHDDPGDPRRAFVGDNPVSVRPEPDGDHPTDARLVDAIIRAAVVQGVPVHLIPTTDGRPRENAAALQRTR